MLRAGLEHEHVGHLEPSVDAPDRRLRCQRWTIRQRLRERGAEPDECYTRGPGHSELRPDIAIEVVWTSGGIDKLEVYRGLEVPEVWFWREGRLETWQLAGDRYRRRERSAVLPELDVQQLAAFVAPRGHTEAQRRYLRVRRGGPVD